MPAAAIKNLSECQKQLDADGTMVGVSRQALDEALASHAGLVAALEWIAEDGCSDSRAVECARAALALAKKD